jgi:hypothetical protein
MMTFSQETKPAQRSPKERAEREAQLLLRRLHRIHTESMKLAKEKVQTRKQLLALLPHLEEISEVAAQN